MLCEAGHVESVAEAFNRYLSEGQPCYVEHTGVSPVEVVRVVLDHGGVPVMAHPGTLNRDEIIPQLVEAGIPAIEVYHSAHDAERTSHYRALAGQYNLVCTGGSDYHGPGTRRSEFFGKVSLPREDFERVLELLREQARPPGRDGRATATDGSGSQARRIAVR